MGTLTKKDIEKPMGGLFLMTLFTLLWTLIAENALDNRDHRIVGIVFSLVIATFVFFYFYFNKIQKQLPESSADSEDLTEKKSQKWFMIIFGIEGFAILLVKNILVNIHRDDLFIPCFALIVGLHFFPLAKVFKRKFDYYLATWTCLVALIGLYLRIQKTTPDYFVTAFVCIGCAIATTSYGIKMIYDGYQLLSRKI
jgi:Ca2+/Na+ antiporter